MVLDYDLNHNEEVLSAIGKQADKVEILVNEICYPGCPKRSEHYRQQSQMQLEYDIDAAFPCPNKTRERKFEECKERPSFYIQGADKGVCGQGFCKFQNCGTWNAHGFCERILSVLSGKRRFQGIYQK